MKTGLLFLLLAIFGATNLIAADEMGQEISLTIDQITPDGKIKVGLHNDSKRDVNVWVGCHSWAYFNWRALLIRNGESRLYAPYPYELFTMNFPQVSTIKPGRALEEKLQLGGEDDWKDDYRPLIHWSGPNDTRPLIRDGDKIVVIFDVRGSNEDRKYNPWVGLTEASKDFHFAAKN
jgi:hypothetical protein